MSKKVYLKKIEDDIGQSGRSLVKLCIERDENSWNLLMNFVVFPMRYKLSMWVKSAGGCQADIEDIYQDFTMKLFKDDLANLRDFLKSDKTLQAWIHNGLKFQFRSWLASDNRKNELFKQIENYLMSYNMGDQVLDLLPEIMDQFDDHLNPKEQKFMHLVFEQKLPDDDIASVLDISEVSVRTRRYRLKEKFRNFLNKELVF
ncbi:MAG: RNA polymerase sigma factor [Candidatus Zixiibacteriota bacterium]